MIQYDSNGLVIQSLLDILSERESACKTIFGDDFYISGESAVANLQSSDADRELAIQELLLYVASQLDPDQAEGIWLDYICALNNITRYQATKSTIPIIVTGTPGTIKNASEVIIVDEATDEYYTNMSDFELDEDGKANVQFQATSWGDIVTLSSNNFSLKTPTIGIINVEYNTNGEATIGRNTETDEELRTRRNTTVSLTATSILSSIKAVVVQINGVKYITVYENDTMREVDGIPAKAFEVVVDGGDEDEITAAILSKKPAGIQAYGNITKTVSDEDGNTFEIGFTRPIKQPIDIQLKFVSDTAQTDEWKNDLKVELLKAFDSIYTVGDNVYVYNLYYILNNHPEIKNVTEFKVKLHSAAESAYSDTVTIGKKELATLVDSNISISQSY